MAILTMPLLTVPLLTTQVREMHAMLRAWAPLKPLAALELLDAKFADESIRSHAVRCLEPISDGELADLVLQLTQVVHMHMHIPCMHHVHTDHGSTYYGSTDHGSTDDGSTYYQGAQV